MKKQLRLRLFFCAFMRLPITWEIMRLFGELHKRREKELPKNVKQRNKFRRKMRKPWQNDGLALHNIEKAT